MLKKNRFERLFGLLAGETLYLVLLLFTFNLPTSQAQADNRWNPPINISSQMNDAWFPDIAVDKQGGVHIVYLGSTFTSFKDTSIWDKYDNLYYTYISPDGSLPNNTPYNIEVAPFGVVLRSSLAVDNSRGLLHLLTRVKGSLFYARAPIDKGGNPNAWSELRNIDDYGTSYYSDIAIDNKGVIHAAWSQTQGDKIENIRSVIVYRQSKDLGKTWSFPKVVATSKYGVTRVVLKIDPADNLHLSWDDGYDNQTGKFKAALGAYSRSTDGGKTWSSPFIFGSEKAPVAQTTLSTFGSNGVMLAWHELGKQRIDFVVSNDQGQTWSQPASVPGIVAKVFSAEHFFDRYYLAGDAKGRVHLAAVGMAPDNKNNLIEQGTDLALFHSVWENGNWSEPEQISHGSGFPEYPRIGIGPDRLNIVWFTRDKPVDETSKSVWYSSKTYDTGLISQPITSYKAPQPTIVPATATPPPPTPHVILPAVEKSAPTVWMVEGYTGTVLALLPVLALVLIMAMKLLWAKNRKK